MINRWMLVEDPHGATARELDLAGSHLLGFAYVDHMAGLTLNVERVCLIGPAGEIETTADLMERGVSWKMRSGSFRPVRALPNDEAERMGLPMKPDWLHVYGSEELDYLRALDVLDPLRAPGFPDDIQVILPGSEGRHHEAVWARTEHAVALDVVECTLLNQPHQDFGLSVGDRITVKIRHTSEDVIARLLEVPPKASRRDM